MLHEWSRGSGPSFQQGHLDLDMPFFLFFYFLGPIRMRRCSLFPSYHHFITHCSSVIAFAIEGATNPFNLQVKSISIPIYIPSLIMLFVFPFHKAMNTIFKITWRVNYMFRLKVWSKNNCSSIEVIKNTFSIILWLC